MKILGIGNALVDVLIQINDESALRHYSLPKGSMTLVNLEVSNLILSETTNLQKKKASGGSAANTIHGLANLGMQTAFIGKVGNDDFGKFFREDMEANKIKPLLYNSITDTGKAIALISPDSERTFATYLGASVELSADDLTSDVFNGYNVFYIEGYLVQNKNLIEKALRLAKSAGLLTCLDLASFNVVRDNIDFLGKMIEQYVDVVFANEEEIKELTGLPPEEALNILADICHIAVIKMGANGSLVKHSNERVHIKADKSNVIDTTGAGDLYASGFIYGLYKNAPMEVCGKLGSFLAGKVIEIIGAKMKESTWKTIRQSIRNDLL